MIPHPEYERLFKSFGRMLKSSHVLAWSGVVYRCAAVPHASAKSIMSGIGAMKGGGRWNYYGLFPVVYTSMTPELAIAEMLAYTRRAGIPDEVRMPVVIKAIEVHLGQVLDLRDLATCARACLEKTELIADRWWTAQEAGRESLTQAIGRAAYERRLEGLIVPSGQSRGPDGNLIVFPGCLRGENGLKVLRAKPRRSSGNR